MAIVKEAACSVCQKPFIWKIGRPGDGYWDRWKNDDGNNAASWFLRNNLCWDHAFERMPEQFRGVFQTELYKES